MWWFITSLVLHRYREKDVTQFNRAYYENDEWKYNTDGKQLQTIVGFDGNALYLWCLGQEISCGRLVYLFIYLFVSAIHVITVTIHS